MKNLTAVMISFMRPEYTMECVKSLKKVCRDIKILVAENGEFNQELKDFVNDHGGRYFLMPFDSGVCFARNRLMELVDTEYVLVGDDDFSYNKDAKVLEMLKFIKYHEEYTLIGGRVRNNGEVANYQGIIKRGEKHLEYIPLDNDALEYDKVSGLNYQTADLIFNYFIARTKEIIDIKWDEKIKVAYEHSDWFISLQAAGGRAVAYSPDPIVIHKPKHIAIKDLKDYKGFRYRKSDKDYFFEKHKIDYIIGFKGKIGMRKTDNPLKKDGRGNKKYRYYAKRKIRFDGRTYNEGDMIETSSPTEDMRSV